MQLVVPAAWRGVVLTSWLEPEFGVIGHFLVSALFKRLCIMVMSLSFGVEVQ